MLSNPSKPRVLMLLPPSNCGVSGRSKKRCWPGTGRLYASGRAYGALGLASLYTHRLAVVYLIYASLSNAYGF